jgi:hypothetical protein
MTSRPEQVGVGVSLTANWTMMRVTMGARSLKIKTLLGEFSNKNVQNHSVIQSYITNLD